MSSTASRKELIDAIAEALSPSAIPISDRIVEVERLCRHWETEFPILVGVAPPESGLAPIAHIPTGTENRDSLVEVANTLKSSARALANSPESFFARLRDDGFNVTSTEASVALARLAEWAKEEADKTALPRARNIRPKKLCAFYAWHLVNDLCSNPPTLTPYGPYLTVATYLYELLTGHNSDVESLTAACRAMYRQQRPSAR